MHELSVCQALLDQVREIALSNHAHAVKTITIRVGPLSGIEPPLLHRAFTIARLNTVAHDARLVMESDPVVVHCRHCDTNHPAPANHLRCPDCHQPCPELVSGDALTLASIDIERPEATPLYPGAKYV